MNVCVKLMVSLGVLATLGRFLSFEPTTVSYDSTYKADQNSFFNYISNPTNFKEMNPTILDLKIEHSDQGKLQVTYTEHLVQIPFITNIANSLYTIDRTKKKIWEITSYHTTCFMYGLLCIGTKLEHISNVINLTMKGMLVTNAQKHSDMNTPFTIVTTESAARVEAIDPGTVSYAEEITYACPTIFSAFCAREVAMQRSLIYSNLRKKFPRST